MLAVGPNQASLRARVERCEVTDRCAVCYPPDEHLWRGVGHKWAWSTPRPIWRPRASRRGMRRHHPLLCADSTPGPRPATRTPDAAPNIGPAGPKEVMNSLDKILLEGNLVRDSRSIRELC